MRSSWKSASVSTAGAIAVLAVAGVSFAAVNDSGVTEAVPTSVSSSWEDRYEVLKNVQRQADVFKSTDPKYAANAAHIARDSRLLSEANGQTVHSFREGEKLCLIWRDVSNGVASSGCRSLSEGNPPGMLVIRAPDFTSSTVVSMVPNGAKVAVTTPDGTAVGTPRVERNVVLVEREGDFDLVIGETDRTPSVTVKARPHNPETGGKTKFE